MAARILIAIQQLRSSTRTATILYSIALAIAVVLIPLAYRTGMPHRLVVMVPSVIYLTLAAYRLIGGFQTDRQLEFEERFIRFAASRGQLMASAQAGGKLWKLSCLVQGLLKSEAAAFTDAERTAYLERSLRSTSSTLLPPVGFAALPVATLVTLAWIGIVSASTGVRAHYVFLIVLPCLALVSWTELRILQHRKILDGLRDRLLVQVAGWAGREWGGFREQKTVHAYRHRMFYRDSETG